ncbi:hypothetical protein [Pseudonocardia acidicola]|uniref:Uncharacterized protein n=1 Tax=Pseudonocardia acidicola TaxID=2724939 RepID=A0ABX1SEX7_9PSEU|nr:hypothetical protein [Pseudonocardia acidicola]NMH98911.1 hypothetical protein [Pseudonocardia acidicola]
MHLDSRDAVAVRELARGVFIYFSDRLSPEQRDFLRPHLLTAMGTGEDVLALAVPAGATQVMQRTPYVEDLHTSPGSPTLADLVDDAAGSRGRRSRSRSDAVRRP